jgi:lipoprotein NlpI
LVDYLAVLKLDKNHSDAWFNRGMVHYLKADYRASARDFDNYLVLHPQDALGFYHRGNARYYGDDAHGACADWNQCMLLGRKDLWKKTKNICKRLN